MNSEKLKNMYENMPKGIKHLLAPLFVQAMIGNPHYKEMHKRLEDFDCMSEEDQLAIQFRELKKQCVYAYQHTEYYKELFDSIGFNPKDMSSFEGFEKVPLIDKFIAQEQGNKLYSDEDIDCYEGHTSGSTGKVFRVLLDRASIYRERAVVCHFMEKFVLCRK